MTPPPSPSPSPPPPSPPSLSEDQIDRYARQILLPQIGGRGQARLMAARVLVVGAGGLGSPLIAYLAAAGVGRIGVVDGDRVERSNLQRQILHTTDGLGQTKVDSAVRAVRALNPDVTITPLFTRLTADNAAEILADYDLVADGSDTFATRFLVNDACHFLGKTLVSAAVARFDGQLATFRTHRGGPCYRCLHPGPASGPGDPLVAAGSVAGDGGCAQAGILGAIAGALGSLQAAEVIKEILDIGETMAGRLLIWDGLAVAPRVIRLPRDPACPLCGPNPRIIDLSGHATGPVTPPGE